MMNAHVSPEALAYVEGRLSPDEAERVEAHLAGCPACRAEVEDLRQLSDTLAAAPHALDASLAPHRARIWAQVRAKLPSAPGPFGRELGREVFGRDASRLHGRAAWAMALAVGTVALTGLLASPFQTGALAATDPPIVVIQTPGSMLHQYASMPAEQTAMVSFDTSEGTTATLALSLGQTPAPIPNP
jgi:anti-sigma factor RsiW